MSARRNVRSIVLAATLATLMTQSRAAQTHQAEVDPSRVAAVFADLTDAIEPGCAVGVMKDGELIHAAAFGYAELESEVRLTADSIFNIASMSKEFTALAVLLLEQRDELSLEDPIRNYVPELGAYAERITLRHLLYHIGGLGDMDQLLPLRGVEYTDPVDKATLLTALADLDAPQGPPGEHFEYSNTSYFLLGLTVARVSGRSFGSFLEQNVFAPLGMKDTIVPDTIPARIERRASAYEPDGKGGFRISESPWWVIGASNVYTSIRDFAKWDANFLSGKVGGKALIEKLQQAGVTRDGTRVSYGAGLRLLGHRQLASIGHPGAADGYRSDYRHFPGAALGVAVMCNRTDGNAWDRSMRIAEMYLDDGTDPGLPWDARAMQKVPDAGALEAMPPGLYREAWTGSYVMLERDGDAVKLRDGADLLPIETVAPRIYKVTFGDEYSYLIDTYFAFVPPKHGATARILGESFGESVEYAHVQAWTPASLQPYVGTYRSTALDMEYRIAIENGRLVLERPAGRLALEPADRDRFRGGKVVLQFAPSSDAAPQFMLNVPGARNIRFQRTR